MSLGIYSHKITLSTGVPRFALILRNGKPLILRSGSTYQLRQS